MHSAEFLGFSNREKGLNKRLTVGYCQRTDRRNSALKRMLTDFSHYAFNVRDMWHFSAFDSNFFWRIRAMSSIYRGRSKSRRPKKTGESRTVEGVVREPR